MATVQRCDRCKADITDKLSGAVMHCADVDTERGGSYSEWDLCTRCYRSFVKGFKSFMVSAPKRAAR